MDYYYALLDNYKLLRQRKFKLSLREEEGEDSEAKDKARQDAEAAFAGAVEVQASEREEKAEGKELVFTKIMSGENKGKTGGIGGPFVNPQMKAVNSLDELDDGALAKVIGYFMKNGEGSPSDADGTDDGTDEVEDNPELAAATDAAMGLDETLMGEEGIFDSEDGRESSMLPGYKPTVRQNRVAAALALAKGAAAGETEAGEGIDPRSPAKEDPTITSKVISSPDIDPVDVAKCIEAATNCADLVRKIHSGSPIDRMELLRASANMQITRNGVEFNGIYIQYRSNANGENDPWRNMADQINAAIKKHNEEECPKEGEAGTDGNASSNCRVEPLKEESRGRQFSVRGPMLEHSTVLNLLGGALVACRKSGDAAGCGDIEEKIGAQYLEMQGDGSLEEVEKLLQKGLCAMGNTCLVDIKGTTGVILTKHIIKYLTGKDCDDDDENTKEVEGGDTPCKDIEGYEGPGMDYDVAVALVSQAGERPGRGLAMLVASTRGHTAYLDGLDVVDATVWGGEGSNLKGQKDDVRVTVKEENLKEWLKGLEDDLNKDPVHQKLDAASKCAGEGGIGTGAVGNSITKVSKSVQEAKAKPTIKKGKGEVTIGIEQKSVDSKRSRVKAGEGNNRKMDKLCATVGDDKPELGEGEEDDVETQFRDKNNERLNACQGEETYSDKGKPKQTAFQAACSFSTKIQEDKDLKAFDDIMSGNVSDELKGMDANLGAEMVNRRYANVTLTADQEERKKAVEEGFAALKKGNSPTKKQKEHMDKFRGELEQRVISETLDKSTDDKGVVSGEAKGYLVYRMAEDSGSLDECIKDVRGYGDNSQGVGLVNTTVYGTMGMVSNGKANIIRTKGTDATDTTPGSPGSNSFEIQTNEGESLMKGSFERGQLVAAMGSDSLTDTALRGKDSSPKSNDKTEEDILTKFLKGQQKLLETLLVKKAT